MNNYLIRLQSRHFTEHGLTFFRVFLILTKPHCIAGKDQVTVCDLTGVGVQDTMIAIKAFELAKVEDRGVQIEA